MKGVKNIEAWRAEEIAKVYLLNSGLVTLLPDYNDKFDFLAISRISPDKKIAIEVKATKYPKSELKKTFERARNELMDYKLPVILMYINYDSENGYFEVLKENRSTGIEPINSEKLKDNISKLIY